MGKVYGAWLAAAMLLGGWGGVALAQAPLSTGVRFATYNTSMFRTTSGKLIQDLSTPNNTQARKVAEIIQRVRPDVLLLNEFDFDAAGRAAGLFQTNYLQVSQNGHAPIVFPYHFLGPVNTGVPSGFDFDNNGTTNEADDAYGFGTFPGQYGLVVFSRLPIDAAHVRTFQYLLWTNMPGAWLPRDPGSGQSYYSPAELGVFRLSSKSHYDVPIRVGLQTVHLLCAHPTPPVFDGAEDRNGLRNHDEIRFWADYVDPTRSSYVRDDTGRPGGLAAGDRFVIVGDMNADPFDGDSASNAVRQFTQHPLINNSFIPASAGAAEAGALQPPQLGNASNDTAAFNGGLRVDYTLPSLNLTVLGSGVFWPRTSEDGYALISASDHRLVWLDLDVHPATGPLLIVR